MAYQAKELNKNITLTGKIAVVAGGTQGIGAAVTRRFAQAGASVFVVGRDQVRGEAVIEELKATSANESQTFQFLQADLSLVANAKAVAEKLISLTQPLGGVHYLVQTQGGPPNGIYSLTTESHEAHFAIQCISRFALSYLLAKSGTLKEADVSVSNGGEGKSPDVGDLELLQAKEENKFGIISSSVRDSNVVTGVTKSLAEKFPPLRTYNIHPGIVRTSSARNAGLSWALVLVISFFQYILGTPAEVYAEIPFFLAANQKGQDGMEGLMFSDAKLKALPTKWVTKEVELREKLWQKMVEIVEQA
ncbi:NAD(P)-binding protein [Meredithblackwellia eburnea MCA 4105]